MKTMMKLAAAMLVFGLVIAGLGALGIRMHAAPAAKETVATVKAASQSAELPANVTPAPSAASAKK